MKKIIIGSAIIFLLSLFLIASYWTEWTEYTSNPAYDPPSGARAYYPSVTYDASQFSGHGTAAYYKMWFDADGSLAYAYSNDGINWTEYNNSNPLITFAGDVRHPVVVYDPNGFGNAVPPIYYYKIWYWNGTVSSIAALRYAESVDGITWVNDQVLQQHPTDNSLQIVTGNSSYNYYFYHCYGPATVIYNPTATNTGSATPNNRADDVPMSYRYVMYYDSSSEDAGTSAGAEQTSLGYSTDGIYWTRYSDLPVLIPSDNSSDWDGKYRYRVSVVRYNGVYHLWYSGSDGVSYPGVDYYAQGIGHASSSDGLNWTIDPDNPALHYSDGQAWRNRRTYTPNVIYDASNFSGNGDPYPLKMWYTGRTGSNYAVGYAYIPAPITGNDPVAIAEADPVSGNVPLNVLFDGSRSYDPNGNIVLWRWNFRDGSPTVQGETVSHTFTTHGTYEVFLMVVDNDGNTASTTVIVTVLPDCLPPVAVAKSDNTAGLFSAEINFDGTESYDTDGTIVSYSWDFGDGSTATGPTAAHFYAAPGYYTATLTIEDDCGLTSTDTVNINIYDPNYIGSSCGFVFTSDREWLKAYERESAVFTVQLRDRNREGSPVILDRLPVSFTVTSGRFAGDISFNSLTGLYTHSLLSGAPGEAYATATVGGYQTCSVKIEYKWLIPPAGLILEAGPDRSLFRNAYTVNLTWSAPDDPLFPTAGYRIYRSRGEEPAELIGETSSTVLSYSDNFISPGYIYSYTVTRVDSDGDESGPSARAIFDATR